jgi:uncharacterized repeat protein (TIGR03803 family)
MPPSSKPKGQCFQQGLLVRVRANPPEIAQTGPLGSLFQQPANAAKTKWTETVLHGFCAQGIYSGCPDGQTPYAGLIIDKLGHLYGTTYQGGAHNQGTVFELIPNAAKTIWTETVLYSFCSQGGESCTDGADPDAAALIMDAWGNLYGTT